MTDFSITTRHEGDTLGQNDKGLITRDRSTYKDSYYFYQANWNIPSGSWANTPVLYISDHTWTDRTTPSASMTVYSNLGAPMLWENGVQIGAMVPLVLDGFTIPDTYTMSSAVTLAAGANNIQVRAVYNNQTYTNSVVWYYHAAALLGTPFARVDFTDSNADLQSGYMADTGQAFNGTYGWVNSTSLSPSANTAGTYNRTSVTTAPFNQIDARTGIQLPTSETWEYALPNGVYDVHVVSADSTNTSTSPNNIVNNLSANGNLLHDIDSTSSFGDNGFDEFYTTVTVTNGFLRVSAGAGSVNPVLAYIDINVLNNTPPAIIGSDFQYAVPEHLQLKFNADVSASLAPADLNVFNQTTGQSIDSANIALNYDTASNTATFTFPGFAQGLLPVGNYKMSILAGSVMNAAGAPLTTDFNVVIVQLLGDWDLNGQQNAGDIPAAMSAMVDLNAYRSAHNLTAAQLLALGDVNDDSHVDNLDLSALLSLLAHSSATAHAISQPNAVATNDPLTKTTAGNGNPNVIDESNQRSAQPSLVVPTGGQDAQAADWNSAGALSNILANPVAMQKDHASQPHLPTYWSNAPDASPLPRGHGIRTSVDELAGEANALDEVFADWTNLRPTRKTINFNSIE